MRQRSSQTVLVIATSLLTGLATSCEEKTTPEAELGAEQSAKTEQPAKTEPAPSPTPSADPKLAGGAEGPKWPLVDPGAKSDVSVDRAVAKLYPTEGHDVRGTVEFTAQGEDGVRVKTSVQNLPPGKHAYHVHLFGDCTGADGKSAGTHFNFRGSSKNPPEDIDRITGDLGELEADAKGMAEGKASLEHASLTGQYSIVGRAVIVHEKPNDESKPPMGAAGGRIACGVIGIAE